MTLPRIEQLDLFGNDGTYPKNRKRYWLIPPEIYSQLDSEFHFDFDPCPYPYRRDGIDIEWGKMNWVNPPFRKEDSMNGHGPTAFARKAIEEQKNGKTSVFIFPVPTAVHVLAAGNPEIRQVGKVNWIEPETGESSPTAWYNALFILRGEK